MLSELLDKVEIEFDKKFLYKLNQIALAHMYTELYADLEAFLRTSISESVKAALESVRLHEPKYLATTGEDGHRVDLLNEIYHVAKADLDEKINTILNEK